MAIRILHIEDNPGDALLVREWLRDSGTERYFVTHSPDLATALAGTDTDRFDLILLDLSVPDSFGIQTLQRVRQRYPHTPIVILSGASEEADDARAIELGAQDYICKNDLTGNHLRRSIRYALHRHNSERVLAYERAMLRSLIDSLPDQIYVKDCNHRFVICNAAVSTLHAKKGIEEVIGKTDFDFFPQSLAEKFAAEEREVLSGKPRVNREERIAGPWGEDCWLLTTKVPLRNAAGEIEGLVGVNRDITERKRGEDRLVRLMSDLKRSNEQLKSAQMQLFQAEKMETVGRLAAGVAHEVKNPLAVALLGLEYLQRATTQENTVVQGVIGEIYDAIRRADSVVGGLLDFSRPRTLVLRKESLNNLVEQTLALLKHEILAKNIIVTRDLCSESTRIEFDAHKLKQLLMNLLLNAIQAMSEYGTLSVRTLRGPVGTLRREHSGFNAESLNAIDFVEAVRIDDNGPGIASENLSQIFEPFFTTKPPGKGTGLGLSVARQIAELHGGVLDVRNRPGGGVSATLILPAVPKLEVAPSTV